MTVAFVLILSIILRFVAAFMAFRLIPLTGRQMAWSLISISMFFMGLRQCFPLFHLVAGNTAMQPDLYAELVGLIISIAMVAGISGIAPIFIDRKRIENALRESEERSRAIFESASDGILIANPKDKRFIQGNTAICSMLGYTKEEINKLTIQDIHPPEAISRVFEEFKKQAKTGRIVAESLPVSRKDGSIFYADISSTPIVIGGTHYIVGIFRDITGRKKAEEALKESEARYRSLFENNNAVMLLIDPDNGAIVDANAAASDYYGWSREVLKERRIDEINAMTGKEIFAEMELARSQKRNHFFFRHRRAGSTISDVEVYSGPIFVKGKTLLYSIIHDITERKKAEKALLFEKQRLTMITDHTPYGLAFIGADGTFEYINPSFTGMFGYDLNDVPNGKAWFENAYPDPQYRKEIISLWLDDLKKTRPGEKRPRVFTITCKDGSKKIVNLISVLLETGQNIMVCQDITQLKEFEEKLVMAASQWRATFDSIADPVMILDKDFLIVRANRAVASLANLPIDKIPGNRCYDLLHHTESPLEICPLSEMRQTRERTEIEIYIDDMEKWFAVTVDPMLDDDGNLTGAVHTMKDITERKAMEKQIRKSEEKYRSIYENSIEGIFQTTPEGRFLSANNALAEMFGYDSPDELIKNITDLSKQAYMDDEERIRYQQAMKKQGTVQGFETRYNKKDDGIFWVSINSRSVCDENGNLLFYEGTMEDITARKHAEEALRESMDRLKGAMQGIVDTISAAVEARDPYTSGHQRRVSDIAAAIAAQMGLSESRIEGIRTAGVIHDLGKISIPSEILSKPRKLSDIEFELMKTHPRIGYDILKDIKFPWPIAQIILQHHEKLDGSGYPQGLKGGEILLEARILAVADVVEAVASHRPYRASLGIEVALEEIEKNKGTLYDADAVRECLKLFREKGYKIV